MGVVSAFQLLEINVISAQDLEVLSRPKMKTYAIASVDPDRKLRSSINSDGHNNPTWNDKFVFKVDDEFLRHDTSAVTIDIYAVKMLKDALVGSVRVLVGNLIPPPTRPFHHHNQAGIRLVALQVRRPSGRPQGILNIGVSLLDSSRRSMPLCSELSYSAVGHQDPKGGVDLQNNGHNNNNGDEESNIEPMVPKPILRRSKSERSERVTFENDSIANSSIAAIANKKPHAIEKESSILSISDIGGPFMKRTKKASSVISGAELREKPTKDKRKKGKAGSVVSYSVVSKASMAFQKYKKPNQKEIVNDVEKNEDAAPVAQKVVEEIDEKKVKKPIVEQPKKINGKSAQKFIPYEPPVTKATQKYPQNKASSSIWSDSEVGPSPSEVAAIVAQKRYPLDDGGSSVLDSWSIDESEEGLRSKLDRWRTELPPIYDRRDSARFSGSSYQSSSSDHRPARRRHSDGGAGLFSCFGNICGIECQCVCGKPSGKKRQQRRYRRSPSFDSRTYR